MSQNTTTSRSEPESEPLPLPIGATLVWAVVLIVVPFLGLPGPFGGLSAPAVLAVCAVIALLNLLSFSAYRSGFVAFAWVVNLTIFLAVLLLFLLIQRSWPPWTNSPVANRAVLSGFLWLGSAGAIYLYFLSKFARTHLKVNSKWIRPLALLLFVALIVLSGYLAYSTWQSWPAGPNWLMRSKLDERLEHGGVIRLLAFVVFFWIVTLLGYLWMYAPKSFAAMAPPVWVLLVGVFTRIGAPGWLSWLVFPVLLTIMWRIARRRNRTESKRLKV